MAIFHLFLGPLYSPPMALCVPKVPIWTWTSRYIIWKESGAETKLIYYFYSLFFGFRLPLKYALMPHFCAFKPPPWPKVPTRSPYGLVTLNPCFLKVLVKNWSLSVNFGDVFSISHSGGLFLAIFSLFWGCYRAPL